jgi:rhodanese-related sulfurtransferase
MKMKTLIILLALVSLLSAGLVPVMAQEVMDEEELVDYLDTYLTEELPQGFGMLRNSDLFTEMLESPPFLVDVREQNEWDENGHIMGAVHIPLRSLTDNLDLLPADLDTPIVIYCAVGIRGTIGMVALQLLGYTNVRNLVGGTNGWVAAEYELVMESEAPVADGPADIDPELVATIDNFLKEQLPQGWGQVRSPDLFTEMLEAPPFLVDVREQNEWDEQGHLDDAVLIPIRTLMDNLDQLPADKSTPIVVYCKVGARGGIATVMLQMLGYNARNLVGGIDGWISAGYDVVGGEPVVVEEEFELVSYLDTYLTEELPQGFGMLRNSDLFTEMLEDPPFLVDVREQNEWDENGHIMGAVHIPLRSLTDNLDLLPADLDTPIVIYCAVGIRGTIGMVALQLLGYTDVRNLVGGTNAWVAEEYELVMESEAPVADGPADIDPELVATIDNFLKEQLPQGWGQVRSPDLFTEMLEAPPFLVDVRQPNEWDEQGYIDGAVLVPIRTLMDNLDQLPEDKSTPIVVYCKVGARGGIATVMLQLLGYNARNLVGGIDGWISAGYDVVGGEPVVVEEVVLPEGELLPADELRETVGELLVDMAFQPGFSSITGDDLAARAGEFFILDVRQPAEYEEGHIPGAVHIPLRELGRSLHLLPDFDQPIAVYCAIGHRGAMGLMALRLLGYDDVTSLRGGLNGWTGELVYDPPTPTMRAFPLVDGDLWATVDSYLTNLPDGFYLISAGDVSTMMIEEETPYLLDVREAAEYAAGHIAGAVNMPLRTFTEHMDMLPGTATPIVVYDSIGHRSPLVMVALQLLGYEDVRNLRGGSDGWTGAGYALVTD